MVDVPNTDEHISNRRSKRSCRLSILKSQPSIEKKEIEPVIDVNDIDEEDPPELYQLGDIFWVRVVGNPWWPALVYGSYYEDNIHTKVVTTARRPKKRSYFVYFFGPDFEYTWTNTNIIPYSGLDAFIREAEISVQNVTYKKEQERVASRFELKVPANKRAHWDKAIEEADQALKLTREQRLENFAELLKNILKKSEEKKRASISIQPSRKTFTPSTDKPSNRSSVKRQKTKSTPVSTSTTLLHVGLPTLTKREEKSILNNLLNHPKNDQLTFNEAQSFACQLVTDIVKENLHYEMSCVQVDWFYDFLLNHPEIVSKYSYWFNEDIKPVLDDSIYFKQCQLKNLIKKK